MNQPRGNGVGYAAVACGGAGLALFYAGWVALVLGVMGFILGLTSLRRVGQGVATNKGAAEIGLLLGALAVVSWLAIVMAMRYWPSA